MRQVHDQARQHRRHHAKAEHVDQDNRKDDAERGAMP
jgi:hypothetical protein